LPESRKILYTIPNFDTAGSGKALINIANRLDRSRFEPHICCSHDRGIFFKEVIASGIPVHLYQTTLDMIPRMKGLLSGNKLALFFRSLKMDLIHSFHYGPDYSEPLAARLAGIPWVYTKKNMSWGGKSKNGWKLRTFLASHILAQNKDMINNFFPDKKNVSLVPRGVDTDEFSPKPKDRKLLEKYQIRKDEKVILAVANLVPVKGIDILLDAFELLAEKNNSIRLLVVGDKENDYGKEMEEMAIQSPHSSRIHFTGKVQNISDYYSIADVFVLPTLDEGRREGCPVSLLEAMSFEIPSVASNVAGIKEILYDFKDMLFHPGDKNDLKNKILFELNNRSQVKRKLREHVMRNFSIGNEVKAHENTYERIL